MLYKLYPLVALHSLLVLPSLSNAGESFAFWEGPNGYTYTKDGLKSHIESASSRVSSEFNPEICSSQELSPFMDKLKKYQTTVDKILQSVISGPFKRTTYNDLELFLDTFGHRLAGSMALERSIDHLKDKFETSKGFDKVWTQNVSVPKWERGAEAALLLAPVHKDMAMYSLGQSLATPSVGITADVIVFDNHTALVANVGKVRDKIVVCNFIGVEGDILDTKNTGYPEIAENGALAVLYKSAATFSLYSPHTRRANLYYNGVVKEIPIAYLTIEDTAFLSRIYASGERLTINLTIANKYQKDLTESRNLFGDTLGTDLPDEHVILSAHTDSWDVGQGAQDDGVGIYLVLQTMNLLSELGLRPRRTVRTALWTAEEYGFNGSMTYIKEYYQTTENLKKLTLAMEADYGCLVNGGFIFHADFEGKVRPNNLMSHNELGCMMTGINEMIGNTTSIGMVYQSDSYGTDLNHFIDSEVPVVSLLGDDGRYFWYHHTDADTVTALNPLQLDYCLVSWATATYILADFEYVGKSAGHDISSFLFVHILTGMVLLSYARYF